MEKTKKKLWIARIVIVILMAVIVLSKTVPMVRYQAYHGSCLATVTSIWEKEVYVHTFPARMYQLEYAYSVDGQVYEGETGWLDDANLGLMSDGDQFHIRFDESKPWNSSSGLEYDTGTMWLLWIGVLCAVWAWLELG